MQGKIVIFDWSGVIIHEAPDKNSLKDAVIRTIKKYKPSLSNEEAYNIYSETLLDENNINISTQNDEISKRKWVNRISKMAKTEILYENFVNTYSEESQKTSSYNDVIKFIYSLKGKCKIGLLSNIIFTCYETLKKQIDLSTFDYVWLSYLIHERKPDIEAFIKVEHDLNIQSENILFIDDKMRNLKVAKARGWNICCANGNELEKIKYAIDIFLA